MADGTIRIDIEVDGKQISVASKELDKLESAGHKSGKGLKSAESSVDSLGSSSAKASKDVKNTADSFDGLADSGSKASKDLKNADTAIDGVSDSSANATKDIKGTSDSIDDLANSGSKAGKDLGEVDSAIDGVADSSIEANKNVAGTAENLDNLSSSANNASEKVDDAKEKLDDVSDGSKRTNLSIKELAVSMGLVAIAAKAFDVLKSSLDGAISRFDTLVGFPVVMERMGFSSEQAQKSISKLSDGIQGLPTTLNGIVASTQNIAILTGDLENATDTALALNNAFLASGSSAADAERGLTQYVQMLSKGEVDMQSWRTLQETMGYAINKTAQAFGYAGKSAQNEFYEALKYGEISFEKFNDKLIELNDGVGGFAEMASTGSAGISTSFGNLTNAVIVGAANMITSFDRLTKEVTGKDIASNLDGLKVVVGSTFKAIGATIEGAAPIVKGFASVIKETTPLVKALSPAIIGLMAAYATHTVITKAAAAIKASNAILIAAEAAQKALTIGITAQTVAQARQTGVITTSNLVIGVLTGKITLATAATIVQTTATYAFGAAVKFLMGPVGWVTAAIGLLVAGAIALVKWFKKGTEEGARLGKKTEELADSTNELSKATEESSAAHEKNRSKIETNAEAYAQLAAKAEEMASRDKLSGEEKKTLNSYIDELNRNVSGLNLVYGEESKALSASSEQILNRIKLMEEEEKLHASQERLTEVIKEQIDIAKGLEEVNELREDWNQKLEDGSVKSGEHKKALKELEEQEAALMEAGKVAGEERVRVDNEIIESSNAVATAAEKDVGRQLKMYDELPDAQKAAVDGMKDTWEDYKNAATDMFDKLSEKSTVSVAEMQKNLEENQRVITNWSENIAKLAERGVDEGLLNTLREAGPESAGHVNALVKASDGELEKLSGAFAKGGKVATDALSKSLGIEDSGILESVGHLVMNTEVALANSINGANFESIGGDISKGLAQGIDAGSKEPAKASKNMADGTTKAAKEAVDSNSPSRVFKQIGTDITDGLVLGIDGGAAKVVQAIQKMLKSVQADSKTNFDAIVKDHDKAVEDISKSLEKLPKVTQEVMKNMLERLRSGTTPQVQVMRKLSVDLVNPFKNTPTQFVSVGQNAMAGLNIGLISGSARVMLTARSIASRVASTMKQALKIHSPSRLMRDDIGKMIPAGIAVGIEENAKSVYKALDHLSSGMILSSTPEVALGTSRMISSGMSVGSVPRESPRSSSQANIDGLAIAKEVLSNMSSTIVIQTNAKQWARAHINDLSVLLENKVINASIMGRG
ncbi:tape measure protein [Lederbergia lenta]|uniref:tape measure protein n=1 Tax=Lederbergia lenta TaxID=1467 RepID=UPI00203DF71A|nr:tape measure protein [Lederbergia lenta]MCM3110687.1 tape measure protein [Lederbergia lenta]